jgi:hypothetical protein
MLPSPSCTESGYLVRSVYCVRALAIPAPGLFFILGPQSPSSLVATGDPKLPTPPIPPSLARFQGYRPEPLPAQVPLVRVQPRGQALVRPAALAPPLVPERVPPLERVPLQAQARPPALARPAEVRPQGQVPAQLREASQVRRQAGRPQGPAQVP